METFEFKTKGGFVATIKKDLTYGEYTEIQNTMMEKMTLDPSSSSFQMSGSFIREMNAKAMQYLLVSLKSPSGEEVEVNSIPSRDGIEIAEKINEIWSNASPSKKN
jgi:hypothetical protein